MDFRLFLLLLLATNAWSQNLELREENKLLRKASLSDLKSYSAPQALALDEGHRNYWVISLQAVLKKVYGPKPYVKDGCFVFVCSDGYRSPVKGEDLQNFPAFLAFGTSDSKPFVFEGKKLGPYYLVWDSNNFPDRKLNAHWPYQVVAIERTTFSKAYAKVLPPKESSPKIQHGFALFRKHCLSCHQINGQGGFMGIDLNAPFSVTEYIQRPFLSKLIDNPQKVRSRATMPGLDPALPQRSQAIADIIAYLDAKALERRKSTSKKATKVAK